MRSVRHPVNLFLWLKATSGQTWSEMAEGVRENADVSLICDFINQINYTNGYFS